MASQTEVAELLEDLQGKLRTNSGTPNFTFNDMQKCILGRMLSENYVEDDVLCVAPGGTGKTKLLVSCLEHAKEQHQLCIVLFPTTELLVQFCRDLAVFGSHSDTRYFFSSGKNPLVVCKHVWFRNGRKWTAAHKKHSKLRPELDYIVTNDSTIVDQRASRALDMSPCQRHHLENLMAFHQGMEKLISPDALSDILKGGDKVLVLGMLQLSGKLLQVVESACERSATKYFLALDEVHRVINKSNAKLFPRMLSSEFRRGLLGVTATPSDGKRLAHFDPEGLRVLRYELHTAVKNKVVAALQVLLPLCAPVPTSLDDELVVSVDRTVRCQLQTSHYCAERNELSQTNTVATIVFMWDMLRSALIYSLSHQLRRFRGERTADMRNIIVHTQDNIFGAVALGLLQHWLAAPCRFLSSIRSSLEEMVGPLNEETLDFVIERLKSVDVIFLPLQPQISQTGAVALFREDTNRSLLLIGSRWIEEGVDFVHAHLLVLLSRSCHGNYRQTEQLCYRVMRRAPGDDLKLNPEKPFGHVLMPLQTTRVPTSSLKRPREGEAEHKLEDVPLDEEPKPDEEFEDDSSDEDSSEATLETCLRRQPRAPLILGALALVERARSGGRGVSSLTPRFVQELYDKLPRGNPAQQEAVRSSLYEAKRCLFKTVKLLKLRVQSLLQAPVVESAPVSLRGRMTVFAVTEVRSRGRVGYLLSRLQGRSNSPSYIGWHSVDFFQDKLPDILPTIDSSMRDPATFHEDALEMPEVGFLAIGLTGRGRTGTVVRSVDDTARIGFVSVKPQWFSDPDAIENFFCQASQRLQATPFMLVSHGKYVPVELRSVHLEHLVSDVYWCMAKSEAPPNSFLLAVPYSADSKDVVHRSHVQLRRKLQAFMGSRPVSEVRDSDLRPCPFPAVPFSVMFRDKDKAPCYVVWNTESETFDFADRPGTFFCLVPEDDRRYAGRLCSEGRYLTPAVEGRGKRRRRWTPNIDDATVLTLLRDSEGSTWLGIQDDTKAIGVGRSNWKSNRGFTCFEMMAYGAERAKVFIEAQP